MRSIPPPAETAEPPAERSVTLVGATGVGVGAIVGGGILVLGGVAFHEAGPSTLLAFALNGVVAVLTALSFAEMSTAFPESGGAYVFAKKVLTVRAAFAVGWVLWFAYIVAGVLYALGFAEYAATVVIEVWRLAGGDPPPWVNGRTALVALALGATAAYAASLIRKTGGGGQWETIGKLVLFAVLIAAGLWTLLRAPEGAIGRGMTPFMPHGVGGILSAAGLTFISIQGFDLIPAIGGEVKQPERNIPRAMLYAIGIGLLVYMPLLFLAATVGAPPESTVAEMVAESPATFMADAARQFAGAPGFWLVVLAVVLSMLSALAANILAASHVALTMARDRTLPRVFGLRHPTRKTPVMAIYASSLALTGILLMVPNVEAAGSAAGLIFLVSFALVHLTSYLARRRSPEKVAFRTPYFPAVQVVGGVSCAGLAAFQAITVPAAGGIVVVWLGLGVILYFALFAGRAKAVDAFTEALDPELAALRGKSPLVLAPVANPSHAAGLVEVATALAPPIVGRVVLLTVMRPPKEKSAESAAPIVEGAQAVVREALIEALGGGAKPETLMTVAPEPWAEIARVARERRCESLLLGMTTLDDARAVAKLEALLNDIDCDIAVLRAPKGWSLETVDRVVVPIGGRGGHDDLRARLLGSLGRAGRRKVRFVRVVPPGTPDKKRKQIERELFLFAEEETRGRPEASAIPSDAIVDALASSATKNDLLVLGLQRQRGRRLFGEVALEVARRTEAAAILISRRTEDISLDRAMKLFDATGRNGDTPEPAEQPSAVVVPATPPVPKG